MTEGPLFTREELETYLDEMYVSIDDLSEKSGLSIDAL